MRGRFFLDDVDDADARPLAWWLERLRQSRTDTLRILQEMDLSTQEVAQRKGTHRSFGEMSVLQILRGLYRHDRMHTDQLLGREQSFVPREA